MKFHLLISAQCLAHSKCTINTGYYMSLQEIPIYYLNELLCLKHLMQCPEHTQGTHKHTKAAAIIFICLC